MAAKRETDRKKASSASTEARNENEGDVIVSEEGNISVVECSWRTFKSDKVTHLFHSGDNLNKNYLFRGHAVETWHLDSSFDRWFRDRDIPLDRADKAKISQDFLSTFKALSEGQPIPRETWDDEAKTLAIAQHYGVLTRLLDWTESPYIAAFFAFVGVVDETRRQGNVVVWSLNAGSTIWSGEYGAEILHVPSYGNERLRNQRGKFTRLKAPYDTLEEYVNNIAGAKDVLKKFLIPVSEAKAALADLDLMGINHSSIFPGVEGCATAANLRMSIRNY